MERKFLPLLIGFLFSMGAVVVLIVLVILNLLGIKIVDNKFVSEFIRFLPGPFYTDIILILLLPGLFFFLFYWIAPYLVLFYIKMHQFSYWLIRRRSKYGIYKLGSTVKSSRLFYRALVVSLFTFSIALIIVEMGVGHIFRPSAGIAIFYKTEQLLIGALSLPAAILIIFFPIWLLEDSGVISYRVYPEERISIDVEGVHSIYYHILIGYAGVSTVLSWISYIIQIWGKVDPWEPAAILMYFLILFPIVCTGFFAFPMYLYEKFFPRLNKRLHKKLARFKFPEIDFPSFEEIQKRS
ncbi:MAG: hypothetical protein HWN66_16155 [Candidatus Helarchaeota archaeon]|nr:hypothetical protein [Candidatus Helarchaeota archaeon]